MAINKSKYDKLDKDHIKSCMSEYEECDYLSYLDYQEDFSYYNYDYYVNSNGTKLCVPSGLIYQRQLKLDELLSLDKNPTIADILPKGLK